MGLGGRIPPLLGGQPAAIARNPANQLLGIHQLNPELRERIMGCANAPDD